VITQSIAKATIATITSEIQSADIFKSLVLTFHGSRPCRGWLLNSYCARQSLEEEEES
jgi:hypothetical protein